MLVLLRQLNFLTAFCRCQGFSSIRIQARTLRFEHAPAVGQHAPRRIVVSHSLGVSHVSRVSVSTKPSLRTGRDHSSVARRRDGGLRKIHSQLSLPHSQAAPDRYQVPMRGFRIASIWSCSRPFDASIVVFRSGSASPLQSVTRPPASVTSI